MIWTPSPRPPWSESLMNLTLRDAIAVMPSLSSSAPESKLRESMKLGRAHSRELPHTEPDGARMHRMTALRLLTIAALGATCAWTNTLAQSGRVYRIGFLATGDFAPKSPSDTFSQGIIRVLGQQGYVLGSNLVMEQRGAEAHQDRLPMLAPERVRRQ